RVLWMAMAPKREPTSAEYQQLLDENDALRAEIVKLKGKLENCEMIRQEQASYIRGLWEDNRRVHAELRYFNRQEERGLRPTQVTQRGQKLSRFGNLQKFREGIPWHARELDFGVAPRHPA